MPAASVSGAHPRCSHPRSRGLTSAAVSLTACASESPPRRTTSSIPVEVSIGAVGEWKERVRRLFYPAYEARMMRALPKDQLPAHVGVMLDGNRRWAKSVGQSTAQGHRAGAANIEPLLEWCDEVGVEVVTLWLLSTDNLNRPAPEVDALLGIITDAVETLALQRRWRLHPVGALDLLPAPIAI